MMDLELIKIILTVICFSTFFSIALILMRKREIPRDKKN